MDEFGGPHPEGSVDDTKFTHIKVGAHYSITPTIPPKIVKYIFVKGWTTDPDKPIGVKFEFLKEVGSGETFYWPDGATKFEDTTNVTPPAYTNGVLHLKFNHKGKGHEAKFTVKL